MQICMHAVSRDLPRAVSPSENLALAVSTCEGCRFASRGLEEALGIATRTHARARTSDLSDQIDFIHFRDRSIGGRAACREFVATTTEPIRRKGYGMTAEFQPPASTAFQS
jgi:hypothetical protein